MTSEKSQLFYWDISNGILTIRLAKNDQEIKGKMIDEKIYFNF